VGVRRFGAAGAFGEAFGEAFSSFGTGERVAVFRDVRVDGSITLGPRARESETDAIPYHDHVALSRCVVHAHARVCNVLYCVVRFACGSGLLRLVACGFQVEVTIFKKYRIGQKKLRRRAARSPRTAIPHAHADTRRVRHELLPTQRHIAPLQVQEGQELPRRRRRDESEPVEERHVSRLLSTSGAFFSRLSYRYRA